MNDHRRILCVPEEIDALRVAVREIPGADKIVVEMVETMERALLRTLAECERPRELPRIPKLLAPSVGYSNRHERRAAKAQKRRHR